MTELPTTTTQLRDALSTAEQTNSDLSHKVVRLEGEISELQTLLRVFARRFGGAATPAACRQGVPQ